MPATTFAREISVSADPATCWKVLTDVPRLVGWISIVQGALEHERLVSYSALLSDRLGPFKMRADLDIRVSEVEEGSQIRLRASGEDRAVGSRLAVDATLTLDEQGELTRVVVRGTYEVIGKVATLGAGVIKQKAEKILDEFFTQAAIELGQG